MLYVWGNSKWPGLSGAPVFTPTPLSIPECDDIPVRDFAVGWRVTAVVTMAGRLVFARTDKGIPSAKFLVVSGFGSFVQVACDQQVVALIGHVELPSLVDLCVWFVRKNKDRFKARLDELPVELRDKVCS